MKKWIQIKLSYLVAAVALFIVYHFWFARHHTNSFAKKELNDQNLFSGNTVCNYKNGNYPATIDYFNSQTKAELTIHASVEIEDCNIIKIKFGEEWQMQESIILPAELEDDGQSTAEDSEEGIYMIRID